MNMKKNTVMIMNNNKLNPTPLIINDSSISVIDQFIPEDIKKEAIE